MTKRNKILTTMLLVTTIISTPMLTLAKGSEGVVCASGNFGETDCIAEYVGTKANSKAVIYSSYTITAGKSSSKRNCKCAIGNGYDFQCTGWVKIVDKKSKTGLRHSTTAALSNPSSGSMYKGAVRNIGAGKVTATSEWVHGWSVPRVFWDWID